MITRNFSDEVSTLTDVPASPVQVRIQYKYAEIYRPIYTKRMQLNPNSNIIEPDGPPNNRPASCVIAQQYSSSTFLSLRFQTLIAKFEAPLQKYCYFTFLYSF
jgi:hypothetical protein